MEKIRALKKTIANNKKIEVIGREISLYTNKADDFISLTDIARYRDAERSDYILQNWMRNRSTIEFMGLWEKFNNPSFNSIEFDGIKNMAGSNSFSLKNRHECTNENLIRAFVALKTQLPKRLN